MGFQLFIILYSVGVILQFLGVLNIFNLLYQTGEKHDYFSEI